MSLKDIDDMMDAIEADALRTRLAAAERERDEARATVALLTNQQACTLRVMEGAKSLMDELTQERDEARAEVARLNKVHLHGCDCAPDDACLFARERDEARGLLGEARDVLALCTTRTFAAPEDAEVRALGERIGFGALMSAVSRGWADVLRERHPEAVGGQHTAGPCEVTVKRMLTQLDAYLEESK